MEPSDACLFWLWIAAATSVTPIPIDARRSGSSQMRRLYFAPMTLASPTPGIRSSAFRMLFEA